MNHLEAMQAAVNGKAVLFCGAGFSAGVSSALGPIPNGAALARELFLGATGREPVEGFDNLELSQVAEYFEKEKGRKALVDFLVKRFSVSHTPDDRKNIALQPWRRVYTTNYDDCLESIFERPLRLRGVTTTALLEDYKNSPNLVVHINGYIRDQQSPFVLSNTDYATQAFVNSPWWHVFRQDIAEAEAVVFIGYSLYDLDIARAMVS
jgi:SIR2-like domain